MGSGRTSRGSTRELSSGTLHHYFVICDAPDALFRRHPDEIERQRRARALLASHGTLIGLVDLTRGEKASRGTVEGRGREAQAGSEDARRLIAINRSADLASTVVISSAAGGRDVPSRASATPLSSRPTTTMLIRQSKPVTRDPRLRPCRFARFPATGPFERHRPSVSCRDSTSASPAA